MNFFELFFLAAGLSMDAFAVAACAGLTMSGSLWRKSLIVGLYFGVFQAGMPLIGYMAAAVFAGHIVMYGHWIAFVLLYFLGGKMIVGGLKKEGCPDRACPVGKCADRECPGGRRQNHQEASLKPAQMLPLALATSIDALAVGVSLSFLQVNIIPAVCLIGMVTFVLSAAGVKIGSVFGASFKSKAELAGGTVLILIGIKILLEGLHVIGF